MKVQRCQHQPVTVVAAVVTVVAAVVMVSPSHAEGLPDSIEVSNEVFRPSSQFFSSSSSFRRPVPRGGGSFEFSRIAAPFSSDKSVFSRFPSSFPSTSLSSPFLSSRFSSASHETTSSYATVPVSHSSPSSSSSPSLPFHSNPSSSFPSITKASAVEILDVSGQDSQENLGLALSSALGFPSSRFTPVRNNNGHVKSIFTKSQSYSPPPPQSTPRNSYKPPSLSQTYGPPPKHIPASNHKAPSLSQTYGPPSPPQPTPFAAYKPPSLSQSYGPPPKHDASPVFGVPFSFSRDSRSRERFTSPEFPHSSLELDFGVPDNSFDTSVESFIGSSSSSRTFGGFTSPALSFSGRRGTANSGKVLAHPPPLNPPLSISFISAERFDSPKHFGSSQPSSLLSTPAKSFQSPAFGPVSPDDSHQGSSDELFQRKRDQSRPVFSPRPPQAATLGDVRPPQKNFVGDHANYFFNYDVNDSVKDGSPSEFGSRRKKGPNFGHSERRNGQRTEGRYYVELPDGRTQVVEYYADKTGYHPTITYT